MTLELGRQIRSREQSLPPAIKAFAIEPRDTRLNQTRCKPINSSGSPCRSLIALWYAESTARRAVRPLSDPSRKSRNSSRSVLLSSMRVARGSPGSKMPGHAKCKYVPFRINLSHASRVAFGPWTVDRQLGAKDVTTVSNSASAQRSGFGLEADWQRRPDSAHHSDEMLLLAQSPESER